MYDVVSKVIGPAEPPTIVVVAVALTVWIDRSLPSPPLASTARAITSRAAACDAWLDVPARPARPPVPAASS